MNIRREGRFRHGNPGFAHIHGHETPEAGTDRLSNLDLMAPEGRFTDLQMPELDGQETARRIRAPAPMLPVVGPASAVGPEIKRRCAAAGRVDIPVRPIDPDALVDSGRWRARWKP